MNDDFFKSLKDNLDNRPEPTFKKDAWTRMQEKLEASKQVPTQSKNQTQWWLPLLLLLVFGLAGSNIWMYRQLKLTNNQQVLVQRDTIYSSKVIVQIDTIYKTKIIRETTVDNPVKQATANNYSPFFNPNIFSAPNFSEKHFPSGANNSSISSSLAYMQSPYIGIGSTIPNLSDYLLQKDNANNKNGLNSLVNKSDNQVQDKIETNFDLNQPLQNIISLQPNLIEWQNNYSLPEIEIPIKKRKNIQQHIYQMRPRTFSLGVKGGYATVVNSQLDNFKGRTYGLNAAIGFSKNFKLWADASFLELIYQSKQIDETLGIPDITPANDNYIFVKAEVPQPAYQFSTGLQYMWNSSGKWKSYLGVGYGVISLVPYEVDYEFNDPSTNIDLTLEQGVNRSELIKGQILFKGGINYQVYKNWSLQVEGMYRMSNRKEGISSPNILGIRTGLSYQF